ncbi:MAG TPA: undecaprenyl-diphosphate phosphatase [Kiritimatiellia bacterium]|nr:undecaprenyl-diphosphate phosphatase [Kiritimatiellia bacterium]HPR68267.1 undecaprenyl-diphosphate phosphatase [Kiritimatiellia bacterium]
MPDLVQALAAAVMGVVEGFTEYLPVSSTGHLELAKDWMGRSFHESFTVVIQAGAMLAVLVEYGRRFLRLADFKAREGFAGRNGWLWLFLTTLPAAVLGLLFHSAIKERLFAPMPIAVALCAGGVLMIVLERLLPSHDEGGVDAVGWKRALGIGLFQCVAMVPGTSRSMATILGGRLMGLGRKTAAEYSFFAAVPVLLLAGGYDLMKGWGTLQRSDLAPYAIGLAVSFFVARVAIRFLMRVISRHTLEGFGWYRIALSAVVWWTLVR